MCKFNVHKTMKKVQTNSFPFIFSFDVQFVDVIFLNSDLENE